MSDTEQKIALNLKVGEVQYILNALCARPINEALNLVQQIQQEANSQIEAAKNSVASTTEISHGSE